MRHVAAILVVASAIAIPAAAEEPAPRRGGYGTTLSLQAGLSSGSDTSGAALGGAVVQQLGARVSIEGAAAYLGHRMGSNALSASASLLFNLRSAPAKTVPYLSLGGGIYRRTSDMGERPFGGQGMRGRGDMMGGGTMGGGNMMGGGPMSAPVRSQGRMWDGPDMRSRSSTDPMIAVGAGVTIDIGNNLFVRPDGRALVVTAGGDTTTVAVLAVHFGWRP